MNEKQTTILDVMLKSESKFSLGLCIGAGFVAVLCIIMAIIL